MWGRLRSWWNTQTIIEGNEPVLAGRYLCPDTCRARHCYHHPPRRGGLWPWVDAIRELPRIR